MMMIGQNTPPPPLYGSNFELNSNVAGSLLQTCDHKNNFKMVDVTILSDWIVWTKHDPLTGLHTNDHDINKKNDDGSIVQLFDFQL